MHLCTPLDVVAFFVSLMRLVCLPPRAYLPRLFFCIFRLVLFLFGCSLHYPTHTLRPPLPRQSFFPINNPNPTMCIHPTIGLHSHAYAPRRGVWFVVGQHRLTFVTGMAWQHLLTLCLRQASGTCLWKVFSAFWLSLLARKVREAKKDQTAQKCQKG